MCASARRRLACLIVLAAAFLGVAVHDSQAATYTWDNSTGDGLWATGGNWAPGHSTPPTAGDTGSFSGVTPGGTVTVTGTATVGTLSFSNSGGAYDLSGGTLLLNQGTVNQTAASATVTNTISSAVTAATSLTYQIDGGTLCQSGLLTGFSGGLIKNGVGTLILANTGTANNYTGTTVINAGTLRNGASNQIPDGLNVAVSLGATWDLNGYYEKVRDLTYNATGTVNLNGGTLELTNVLGGSGLGHHVNIAGTGTLILSGGVWITDVDTHWDMTGVIHIMGGAELIVGHGDAMGTILASDIYVTDGTLALMNYNNRLSPAVQIHMSTGGTLLMKQDWGWVDAGVNQVVGALEGTGGTVINNDIWYAHTLTVYQPSGTYTFGGLLTDGPGHLVIVKGGAGTWILTGANTYSGGTTLTGGKLILNNASGSALGSRDLVLDGGTLASGSVGSLTGSVLAGSGAHTISPGDHGSVGVLYTGSLNLTSNTTLDFWDITSTTVMDRIVSSGSLNFSGGGTAAIILPSFISVGTYKLIDFTSLGTGLASNFSIRDSGPGYSLQIDGANYDLNLIVEKNDWVGASGATWTNAGNWSLGMIPNSQGASAAFIGNGGATVSVNGTVTVGSMEFDGWKSYNIAGGTSPKLVFDNGADSAGIQMKSEAAAQAISTPVTLNSNTTVTNTSSNGLTFSGVIAGAGKGITLAAGLLILEGTNTYSGITTVTGGSLRAADGTGLPAVSNLVLAGGVLEGSGPTTFTRNLGSSGSKTVRWTGSGGFSAYGGKMIVAIGGTTSPTALVWASGNFVPSGAALVLGWTTADSETEFRNAINFGGATRTITVNDNPATSADFATLTGALTNGGLLKSGNGLLVLTGGNNYSGGTTIAGGTLRANDGAALPTTGNLVLAGGILEAASMVTFTRGLGAGGGQVQWTASGGFSAKGGKFTIAIGGTASPTALTWGSGGFVPSGSALIFGSPTADRETEFRNAINLGGDVRTVTVNDNPAAPGDLASLSGVLSNGSLLKSGSGVLLLKVSPTYTGATTIAEGTLRLMPSTTLASTVIEVDAGATFDVSAVSGYSLAAGRVLKGEGTVLGNITVRGTLAPGSSPGVLSVTGSVTYANGSTLEIEIGGEERGIDYDVVDASGAMTVASGATLSVSLIDDFAPVMGDEFDIMDFSTIAGEFTTYSLPALGDGLVWDTSGLYTDGTIGVTPEPATFAMVVGGLAIAFLRRRPLTLPSPTGGEG